MGWLLGWGRSLSKTRACLSHTRLWEAGTFLGFPVSSLLVIYQDDCVFRVSSNVGRSAGKCISVWWSDAVNVPRRLIPQECLGLKCCLEEYLVIPHCLHEHFPLLSISPSFLLSCSLFLFFHFFAPLLAVVPYFPFSCFLYHLPCSCPLFLLLLILPLCVCVLRGDNLLLCALFFTLSSHSLSSCLLSLFHPFRFSFLFVLSLTPSSVFFLSLFTHVFLPLSHSPTPFFVSHLPHCLMLCISGSSSFCFYVFTFSDSVLLPIYFFGSPTYLSFHYLSSFAPLAHLHISLIASSFFLPFIPPSLSSSWWRS